MTHGPILIVGGGIAGLWLCDALRRRGDAVLLVESTALGAGQTIGSQGIIHGGVKYSLAGMLSESAANIGEMPARWLAALEGRAEPDLRGASLRAPHCHLWQTEGLASGLGMLGARLALEVTPRVLAADRRPPALRAAPGTVAQLDEPVVDPGAILAVLAERNARHLLLAEVAGFHREASAVTAVTLRTDGRAPMRMPVGTVVLTAGRGNATLRTELGLDSAAMQRRPLHMVLVRGNLPPLNGHCVDGGATRATITTVVDSRGRVVWMVGGLVSEQGVGMTRPVLLQHAREELAAMLPGVSMAGMDWSTWRIDRAERATPGGQRPDDVQVMEEGNVLTAWPTKLALAPRLTDRLLERIAPAPGVPPVVPADWPRPAVAEPPWDTEAEWTTAA